MLWFWNIKWVPLGPKISIWKQLWLRCPSSLASLVYFLSIKFLKIPFCKWKLNLEVKVERWLSLPLPVKLSGGALCCPSVMLSHHFPTHSIMGNNCRRNCWGHASRAPHTHLPPPRWYRFACLFLFPVSHKINFFCSCHSLETLLLLSLSRRGKRQREKREQ